MDDLSKTVAQDMMVRILSGSAQAESALPKESEFAEQYGVSRVVVREAKKRLQVLGMLKSKKRAGSHVTPKSQWNFFNGELFTLYLEHSSDSRRQMENYYAMRMLLEPEVAALVAHQHSPIFIEEMHSILDVLDCSHKKQDTVNLLESDLAFHVKIFEESDNILLLPLANLMRPLFLRGFKYSQREWDTGFGEHWDLFVAIRDGNQLAAREYSLVLVKNALERYHKGLRLGMDTMGANNDNVR